MKPKWSAKTAARITGAATTAVLAIGAMAVVGVSDERWHFGSDLNQPIARTVDLPDQTFHVVCTPGIETDDATSRPGRLFV